MASQTIRISPEDHTVLAELAKATGKSMTAVLSEALRAYKKQELLEATNAAYARLRKDPGAWREEEHERAAWEGTLADGLEPHP